MQKGTKKWLKYYVSFCSQALGLWTSGVGWWKEVAYEDGKFTLQGLLDGILEVFKEIEFMAAVVYSVVQSKKNKQKFRKKVVV